MASSKRNIYITGITGLVGQILTEGLKDRYNIRGNSRRGTPVPGAEVTAGDIVDGEFLKEQFRGIDTVIHLAADPSARASWPSVLKNNIDGTYHMYEAAVHAGVKRVIFASTNHVTGILTEKAVDMDTTVPVRPDGFYGISKATGEDMGRYYSDRHGLSVLNFRIGWAMEETSKEKIVEIFRKRNDAYPLMWLSAADCVHAHECGIEADPAINFGTYYVMSGNRDGLWDMTNARDELGYEPKDDLGAIFDEYGLPYSFRIPRHSLG